MHRNLASLSLYREYGCFQRDIAKDMKRPFLREQDFSYNLHERNMKNIYGLDAMKYTLPVPMSPQYDSPPYAVEFCTVVGSQDIFAVADEEGNVSLFSSLHSPEKSGPLLPLHTIRAHTNAIFDIAWVPKQHVLVTASGDKTATIWDMVKGTALVKLNGHSCSLRTVNVSKHDTNLLVTGSRDGNALVWDQRTTEPTIRIRDAHVKENATPKRRRRSMLSDSAVNDSQQTVSCALFQDERTVVTAGTRDGTIKIWDLRKLKQIKKITAKNKFQPIETLTYPGNSLRRRGYSCLTFDSSNSHLYASCTDDSVYHYSLATACPDGKRMPVCRYTGHINSSFYVRTALSYDNQFLLSGSCDNKAYIWSANGKCESPIVRLKGNDMSEVTVVAWSPNDITRLVTCSDECVVRLWKMPYGKEESKCDIDARAEAVTKDILGCKCGCNFSPISVVPRRPTSNSSGGFIPVGGGESLLTPKKPVEDANSILTTPTRKLVQTSVTSLFTPTRSSSVSPSTKITAAASCTSNNERSPAVTGKCYAGKANIDKDVTPGKRIALKSLDSEMNTCDINDKENVPADTANTFTTPKKNWLLEHARKRTLGSGGKPSSKRHRQSLSSPVNDSNGENSSQRQAKTISSYFKTGSLF